MDVEFTLRGSRETSNGFGIFLVKHEMNMPNEIGNFMGYRNDFNGIGVALYKSVKKDPNRWVTILFSLLLPVCVPHLEQRNEAL